MTPISRPALTQQLRTLGVREGGVLLMHTAFRALGPVEGGIEALIGAVRDALGAAGTLVMPSWTGDDDAVFDPVATPAAEDLGATAQVFWRLPGVLRSDHPFAFAAAGPQARRILRDELPLPPHRLESPVGRVWELDGQVLLLGCGHDANTSLHLAEVMAGAPYRTQKHVTVLRGGVPRVVRYGENDCCTERFALADGWLRDAGLQAEGRVGQAIARLFDARDLVRLAMERLAADPLVFLHPPDAGCAECDEARASVV